MFAHSAFPSTRTIAFVARKWESDSRLSKYHINPSMKIQLKTCGLASQCRLAVDSMGEANRHARKKFPPAAQFSRTHSQVTRAMAIAKIQTSPLKPATPNTPPMTQSAPHSQATQGCPARVNE